MKYLIDFIHINYPGISVILDAKRGDVPSTAECYAKECFERYSADATTVQPYLGTDAILPFSSYKERGEKGVFVLCKTSNPGSSDLQEHMLDDSHTVYMRVASLVSQFCSKYDNCGLVMGATYVDAIARVRLDYPDMWFLVPGVGVQGGHIDDVIKATKGSKTLITVSRSISYPSFLFPGKATPASAALAIRDQINRCILSDGY